MMKKVRLPFINDQGNIEFDPEGPVPAGIEQHRKEGSIFIPLFVLCQHRTLQHRKLRSKDPNCKCIRNVWFCNLLTKDLRVDICNSCSVEDKGGNPHEETLAH
jgi:hypothetical protein